MYLNSFILNIQTCPGEASEVLASSEVLSDPNLNSGVPSDPNINSGVPSDPNLSSGVPSDPNLSSGCPSDPILRSGVPSDPNLVPSLATVDAVGPATNNKMFSPSLVKVRHQQSNLIWCDLHPAQSKLYPRGGLQG